MRPTAPLPSRLVGRDAELARILGGLEQVRVVVVYGVGGVGKSALVSSCAVRLAQDHESLYHRCVAEPLGELLDDLRRALGGERVQETGDDDDERLDDLAQRLERRATVLLLDDLHALGHADRHALLVGLGLRLRQACVLAASRERVARRGGDPDRLELQLEGLDPGPAAELWAMLDELYGPVAGFEQAMAAARGNPFLLRRAHAGGLHDDDPVAAAVAALDPAEHVLAVTLAAADRPLPMAALEHLALGKSAGVREVVRALSTRLLCHVDGAGNVTLHALVREAVLAASGDAELRRQHGAVAALLPHAGLDAATEVREVARQLIAAGELGRADELLVDRGAELVRLGASGVLRRSLEAIALEHRSSRAQLTYARCLYRGLELGRAFVELERLAAARVEPQHEIRYSFGTVAFTSGRVALGVGTLRELLAAPALSDDLRLQVTTQYAWLLAYLGRIDEAQELLLEAEAQAASPETEAVLAFYRAGAMWSAGRDDAMRAALDRLRAFAPQVVLPYATSSDSRLLLAAMTARLGKRDEAQRLLEQAGPASGEDRLSQAGHNRMRGTVCYELGDHDEALRLLSLAAGRYHETGSVSALVTDVWIAKTMLALGRRRRALALLDEVQERAGALGVAGTGAAAERARGLDPLGADGPEPEAQRAARRRRALADYRTVVDARRHELRSGELSVSLRRRTVLRRLLYALAARPGEVVPKEQLARAMWQVEYHPLRHDNGLWVNVGRLRALLEPSELQVEQDGDGYRLRTGPSFLLIEP